MPATAPAVPFADWGSVIPEPPANDDIRWHAAFQDELVRGYLGTIALATSIEARSGRTVPSLVRLEKLVGSAQTGRGEWLGETASGAERRWNRAHPAGPIALTATARADGGWDLVFWQERPSPAVRFQSWAEQARAGSATAAALVARHRGCVRLPADLRADAP